VSYGEQSGERSGGGMAYRVEPDGSGRAEEIPIEPRLLK
jgi:hypothetical protein